MSFPKLLTSAQLLHALQGSEGTEFVYVMLNKVEYIAVSAVQEFDGSVTIRIEEE